MIYIKDVTRSDVRTLEESNVTLFCEMDGKRFALISLNDGRPSWTWLETAMNEVSNRTESNTRVSAILQMIGYADYVGEELTFTLGTDWDNSFVEVPAQVRIKDQGNIDIIL